MKIYYNGSKNLASNGFLSAIKKQLLLGFSSKLKRRMPTKFILASSVFILSTNILQTAQAQTSLKFGTNCTLKSGTDKALNAKYLYTLVNDTLDCIVTISDIQGGAVLYSVDNNTITGSGGWGGTVNRFQPIISVPKTKNNTSYVKFHFQLIKKGTYNASTGTGTNAIPSHMLWMRAYDVDGNGDTYGVKEFVETSSAFTGAWPDESTCLVSQTPIMSGGKSFIINNSTTNGNNIADTKTLAYNAFLYPGITGAWDIIGGSYVGTNLPSISSGFDDGDRLNSWDFALPAIAPGADFGDAPVSYETSPVNPAYHIVPTATADVDVYLGSIKPSTDLDPISSAAANTDASDDGLATTKTSFGQYTSGSFTMAIKAMNSSGANAYLYGWIDFNGNGVFDAAERSTKYTVSNSSSAQTVTLTFSGAFTYNRTSNTKIARFRIGSTDAEVSTPTGKASNGEVEDYALTYSAVLPLNSLSLSANQQNGVVKLSLSAKDEDKVARYAWQQSTDGATFTEIGTSPFAGAAPSNLYTFTNTPAAANTIYYRAIQYGLDGSSTISNVVVVKLNDKSAQISAMPTLITDYTSIKIQSAIAENLTMHILNNEGKMMLAKVVPVAAGSNTFAVDGWSKFANGTYFIQLIGSDNQSMLKVVVQH